MINNYCKTFLFYFIHFTFQPPFSFIPLLFLLPFPFTSSQFTPIPLSETVRPPVGSQYSRAHSAEAGPGASTLHQGWTRHPTIWNRLQKTSSCTEDSSRFHCEGSQKTTGMQNCHPHGENLYRSYAGSPAVCLASMTSCKFGSTDSGVPPSWSHSPLLF